MQLPNAACVHGNHTQDVMCDSVRGNPRPAGVRLPSGGTFCFITRDGHMVTRAIADANRVRLREEATRKWVGRAVQGKIASCHTQLYAPTMDLRLFTACKVHTRWACLRLPSDRSDVVDLSRILYRSIRAVGGGWTEWQHSDGSLAEYANQWQADTSVASARVCPLCTQSPGTPRHVIMGCSNMVAVQAEVKTIVEQELSRWGAQQLIYGGGAWVSEQISRGSRIVAPTSAQQQEWPILSSWGWLISTPNHEQWLCPDIQHSAPGIARETAADLAYRGVMPAALGRLLVDLGTDSPASNVVQEAALGEERQGTMLDQRTVAAESLRRQKTMAVVQAPTSVITALLLGIRKLRYVYAERINAWKQLRACSTPQAGSSNDAIATQTEQVTGGPHRITSNTWQHRLSVWTSSAAGQNIARQLRWQLLRPDALVARISQHVRCERVNRSTLLSHLGRIGVPHLSATGPTWGSNMALWQSVNAALGRRCMCPRVAINSWLCLLCNGVSTPLSDRASAQNVGICQWCQQPAQSRCVLCKRGIHYTGECPRWLRGAHAAYRPDPLSTGPSCPDCRWHVCHTLSDSPRRTTVHAPHELQQHMSDVFYPL